MRFLIAHHIRDGHTNHYVGGRLVDAAEFRAKFRDLKQQLVPSVPQSTGFGYRVVWEIAPSGSAAGVKENV